MKIILYVVGICLGLYFLAEFILRMLRPYFLNKYLIKVEEKYAKVKKKLKKDVDESVDNLNNYENNVFFKIISTRDDVENSLKMAKENLSYMVGLNEKFIKLKEKFVLNNKKLAEAIVLYDRFFQLYESRNAYCYLFYMNTGESSEEKRESLNEMNARLEQAEKNIEKLLEE